MAQQRFEFPASTRSGDTTHNLEYTGSISDAYALSDDLANNNTTQKYLSFARMTTRTRGVDRIVSAYEFKVVNSNGGNARLRGRVEDGGGSVAFIINANHYIFPTPAIRFNSYYLTLAEATAEQQAVLNAMYTDYTTADLSNGISFVIADKLLTDADFATGASENVYKGSGSRQVYRGSAPRHVYHASKRIL